MFASLAAVNTPDALRRSNSVGSSLDAPLRIRAEPAEVQKVQNTLRKCSVLGSSSLNVSV